MSGLSDFEIYLQRYMQQHRLPRDDVLQLAVVREVKRYYESREGGTQCEP